MAGRLPACRLAHRTPVATKEGAARGPAPALTHHPQPFLEPRDLLRDACDLVLRLPDPQSPALDLAAGAVPLPEGRDPCPPVRQPRAAAC